MESLLEGIANSNTPDIRGCFCIEGYSKWHLDDQIWEWRKTLNPKVFASDLRGIVSDTIHGHSDFDEEGNIHVSNNVRDNERFGRERCNKCSGM